MRKFIGDKEQKLTGLRRVIEILSFSMRKHRKGENRILLWAFGMSMEDGVMMRIALPKLPYLILTAYTAPPTHAGLRSYRCYPLYGD